MKTRIAVTAILATASLLSLASCDALFSTNLFRSLDPSNSSPAALGSMSLGDLEANSRSDRWIDEVSSDPASLKAAEDNLDTVIQDPDSSPADVQVAVDIWTNLELASTGADELIGGIVENVSALQDAAAGDGSGSAQDVVDALFPDGMPTEDQFVALFSSMAESAERYAAYAASITVNADGSVSAAPDGVNAGELAQNALACILVSGIGIDADGDGASDAGTTPAQVAQALWAVANNESAPLTFQMPDLSDASSPLSLIMAQAGLDLSTFITQGEN